MNRKHATWTYDGRTSHPLYSTWRGMIGRCRNSHMRDWDKYGGKGVKVCDRWRDPVYGFFNFVKYGRASDKLYIRQNKLRWRLFSRELQMGYLLSATEQS